MTYYPNHNNFGSKKKKIATNYFGFFREQNFGFVTNK